MSQVDEFIEGIFGQGRVIRHALRADFTEQILPVILCEGSGWGTGRFEEVNCPTCLEMLAELGINAENPVPKERS